MKILILCEFPVIAEIRDVNFIPSIGMQVFADCFPCLRVKGVVCYPTAEYIISVTGKLQAPIDAIVLCGV